MFLKKIMVVDIFEVLGDVPRATCFFFDILVFNYKAVFLSVFENKSNCCLTALWMKRV